MQLGLVLKTLGQLGLSRSWHYASYQAGLRSGYYRRLTPDAPLPIQDQAGLSERPLTAWADPGDLTSFFTRFPQAAEELVGEAVGVCAGEVRLFGGQAVPLQLRVPGLLAHWTEYETGRREPSEGDIKFIWEPARFGWAYILARAYRLTGRGEFVTAFWRGLDTFLEGSPPFRGPHWISAQEAALRLIAMVFTGPIFLQSDQTTRGNAASLAAAVASHAHRVACTLHYAQAQNNNHLVSEAVGLYTAGVSLAWHPQAARWRKLGWRWLNRALQAQIAPDGTYTQHSTNYHRLLLQLSLWVDLLLRRQNQGWPEATRQRLAAAASWLAALADPNNGRVPNLGANDGALVLPLASVPFDDYRPTLQAAGRAFLGKTLYTPGPWDELSAWLGLVGAVPGAAPAGPLPPAASMLVLPVTSSTRAVLRAAHFNDRPSHADQLHVDLWWRGVNIAIDPGTFQYNAAPPWDNRLSGTGVHNTLVVDERDQMTRAGRFLWLDWAQAEVIEQEHTPDGRLQHVVARHNGYARRGVIHQRSLSTGEDGWVVVDQLLPVNAGHYNDLHTVRLHWLLPDWPWRLDGEVLRLQSPYGAIQLQVSPAQRLALARAGECLAGSLPVSPVMGWCSPTYGARLPALALLVEVKGSIPLQITSRWRLPAG